MPREILFRAKGINTGEWFESMTIAKGTIKRKRDDYFMEIEDNIWRGIHPETISQFIGTINGHRFFENDIIQCDKLTCRYVLLHNPEQLGFSAYYYDEYEKILNRGPKNEDKLLKIYTHQNKANLFLMLKDKEVFRPIGNIFDNPELLKS